MPQNISSHLSLIYQAEIMKIYSSFILLLSAFLFQSCVQSAQLKSSLGVPTSDENATIVVLRPYPLGTAVRNDVYHNGFLIGYTGVRSYLKWQVKPGMHTIGSGAGNLSFMQLDAKPGETYYLKQSQKIGVVVPNVDLVLMDEEKGAKKYAKLNAPALVEVFPASPY